MILPWREVDGISTSLTARETAKLRELAKDALVLEVGSAFGYSAIQMAQAGARNVVAVDPHAGELPDSLRIMQENIAARGLGDTINVWRAISERALAMLIAGRTTPWSYDLIFIDGDHSEEAVTWDAYQAWRLLKPGGTLACHDYGEDSCPGVKAALDAWREPDEVVDTLWLARKP